MENGRSQQISNIKKPAPAVSLVLPKWKEDSMLIVISDIIKMRSSYAKKNIY